MKDKRTDLGPCCCCEKIRPDVRNIMMLHKRAPIPGRGWGCLVCGLPSDGAVYVCCDECLEKKRKPKFACRGYPKSDRRIPIEQLTESFKHDEVMHHVIEAQYYRPEINER